MPVRFRCSECRSKLSIARRKVGTRVACPNCGQLLTVPATDEAHSEVTQLVVAGSTATTAGPPRKPSALPPPVRPAPPLDLENMPLFERSDFERMLEPAVREVKESSETPTPPPAATRSTDAILIHRSTMVTLGTAVAVLMGLAFAAGVLVGSR